MGILDDAIREHLELKRRHGVPEDDIQRQEAEALGPARREVGGQPETTAVATKEAAPMEAAESATAVEPPPAEPEPPVADAPLVAEPPVETPPVEEPSVEAPPVEEPPAEEPPVEEPPVEEPPVEEPPMEEPPAEEPPVEVPPGKAALGDTEPHGFPVVEGDEEHDEDLDVLEDTPDFLQETPEHDRLWFEQKPPRDFDFD